MARVRRFQPEGEHGPELWAFECPGCGETHAFQVNRRFAPWWEFNGDASAPTFSPSLVQQAPGVNGSGRRCHFFVRAGRIEFLNDSTHALAGQAMELDDDA